MLVCCWGPRHQSLTWKASSRWPGSSCLSVVSALREGVISLFYPLSYNRRGKWKNNQKTQQMSVDWHLHKKRASGDTSSRNLLMAHRCLRGNVTLISKPRAACQTGGLIRRITALLSGPDFDFRLNYLAATSRSRQLVSSDFSRRFADWASLMGQKVQRIIMLEKISCLLLWRAPTGGLQ